MDRNDSRRGLRATRPLEPRHQLRVQATVELGVQQMVLGGQSELVEPLDRGTNPILVGELRVGLAAPASQGLAQDRRRADRVVVGSPAATPRHRLLEDTRVDRVVGHPQHVPGGTGVEHGLVHTDVEYATQPCDVAAQRRLGSRCRMTGEDGIDQSMRRHRLIAVHQQHRKQPALACAADVQVLPIVEGLHVAKYAIGKHPAGLLPRWHPRCEPPPPCRYPVAVAWQSYMCPMQGPPTRF